MRSERNVTVSPRTVLITGATGYLGTAIREALAGSGWEWYGVARRPPKPQLPKEHWIQGDLLEFAFPDVPVTAVAHYAGIVGDARCAADPDLARRVNVEGTARVLVLAQAHGVPHFLFASSASIYDRGTGGTETYNEDSAVDPGAVYGKTKLEAEQLLLAAGGSVRTTILRQPAVYGAGQGMQFDTFLHRYVYQAIHGKRMTVFDHGGVWRPALSLHHAVAALRLALDRVPERSGIHNVVTENQSVRVYAERIQAYAASRGIAVAIEPVERTGVGSYRVESRRPLCDPGDPVERFAEALPAIWKAASIA